MPVVSIDDVFINAGKLREEWNLGNDGIVCFIDLLEVHGIKVVEIDASGAFDGFSAYVNEKFPVIVLDKNVSAEQKRLTAAHELGHLVLSFDASLSSKETEKLCSLFASEFLIPRETFISFVGRKRPSLSFGELEIIQRQYGISCDALMKKARDCGVLSEFAYSSYCNKKNSLPLYKAMFDESRYPGESSERFARLVYKALSSELITESKAAALIGSSLELIRKNSFIG